MALNVELKRRHRPSNLFERIIARRSDWRSNQGFKLELTGSIFRDLELSRVREFDQTSHTSGIKSIDLDRDEERYMLAGLGDGTLSLHDLHADPSQGQPLDRSKVILRIGPGSIHAHKHAIKTVSWYSDDTGIFLTSGRDGKLKVWDANAGKPVDEFQVGEVVNRHAVGERALVAVANRSNIISIVDLKSGNNSHMLRGHGGEVFSLCWSPLTPNILASASKDKKVMLWDVRQSRSCITYLDYNNVRYKKEKDLRMSGVSHQSCVHGLTFSSCGKYLFSVGSDKRLRKWDAATFKNTKTNFPAINSKHVTDCLEVVTTDTHLTSQDLLFLPVNCNIALLDTNSGYLVKEVTGHYSQVSTLSCSTANLALYSGGADRYLLQWDSCQERERQEAWGEGQEEEESGGEATASLHQYTVDTWSSDEEN